MDDLLEVKEETDEP